MRTLTLNGWTALYLFLLLASNVGWLVWHKQTVHQYELANQSEGIIKYLIQECMKVDKSPHLYETGHRTYNVNCQPKPQIIFASKKAARKWRAMGGR